MPNGAGKSNGERLQLRPEHDSWRKQAEGFGASGALERIRTPGRLIRSQVLYPAELPAHALQVLTATSDFKSRTPLFSLTFRFRMLSGRRQTGPAAPSDSIRSGEWQCDLDEGSAFLQGIAVVDVARLD